MADPGKVVSIHVTALGSGAMRAVPEVRAVRGRGLEGDRYFLKTGSYTERKGTGRQVTLIEVESIDALAKDYRLTIHAKDSRRNIAVSGVALNHLVGKRFRVGGATFLGKRLCEPCHHLEAMCGKPVRAGLVHRGGLRADVVRSGRVRKGDPIRV